MGGVRHTRDTSPHPQKENVYIHPQKLQEALDILEAELTRREKPPKQKK
ncbi:hypothetical protein [uncultured Helicobacter sp.]